MPAEFNMHDFIKHALFRSDPHFGIVAEYRGQDYEIAPDGVNYVRVVAPDGETLGRMTFTRGQFVPA